MSRESDENMCSPDQPLLPLLRSELVSFAQTFDGQPFWVYKDSLSLRYYRFSREEHFLIEQLRRPITLDQLKEAHRNQFNSGDLSNQEIGMFISSLTEKNLLVMNQPNRDKILYESAKKNRNKKLFGQFINLMFIKIPIYDPDRLFDRMIGRLRFFWTHTFLLFYLLLLAAAAGLVIGRWHDFTSMFHTSFFTIWNVPILFAVIWLTKALHEFGHGLTCKNYGGEVHELGILILVFMPMLYCNITDSWTFPNKAHRLATTAGGILTELMIAALATIVWYFTEQPGFIHAFAFNTMIVCSISTVMFNANPLLRFDGYYVMMDLIEVPNLRQRSSMAMRNFFVRYILGGRSNELPEEHRFRFIFPLYSVSAMIYRWFIVFVITFSIYAVLKGMHLVMFGRAFVVFSLLTMLILPLYKAGSMITKQRRAFGISNVRLLTLLAILVILAAGALFWPLEQYVTLNFILEPAQMQWLRSEVDGKVDCDQRVREGVWIDTESPMVACLENLELPYENVLLQSQIAQTEIDVRRYENLGYDGQVKYLRERLQTLRNDEERVQQSIANLQVKVPFTGEVLTRNVDIDKLQGKYVPRAAPLLLLADTRQLLAKALVPEKTYARVFKQADHVGQNAELMLYAFSKEKFKGKVASVSLHRQNNMGEFGERMALSNKVGGEVLTEYDPVSEQEKPIDTVYEVSIELEQDTLTASALPYMSGRVRIDCGSYTLYRWGMDSLLRFISPDVRLGF